MRWVHDALNANVEKTMRSISLITSGMPTSVGPLSVAQPLPVAALRYADPFILLHHAGPQYIEPTPNPHKIEAHPHRGFEPVTFVYQGNVLHRDSLGNEGYIGAGEVQWITSGSGIIHEEGPTLDLARTGGNLELIQLWINLPADKKMMTPAYQELHKDQLSELSVLGGHGKLSIVAGELQGIGGPATTQSPITAAMGWLTTGAKGELPLPTMQTVLMYVLGGDVTVGGHRITGGQLALFNDQTSNAQTADTAGEGVPIEVHEEARILLLGGMPLNEPIVSYGPFVMNTEDEIRDAFRDYAGGKFGSL